MSLSEIFGPAEKLHAAIRRRAPQLAVSVTRDDGLRQVHVTYRNAGPRTVSWDGDTYRWCAGPGDQPLPADPEQAADVIAEALGARTALWPGDRP